MRDKAVLFLRIRKKDKAAEYANRKGEDESDV